MLSSGKFYTYPEAGSSPSPLHVCNSPYQRHSALVPAIEVLPALEALTPMVSPGPNTLSAARLFLSTSPHRVQPWCSEHFTNTNNRAAQMQLHQDVSAHGASYNSLQSFPSKQGPCDCSPQGPSGILQSQLSPLPILVYGDKKVSKQSKWTSLAQR